MNLRRSTAARAVASVAAMALFIGPSASALAQESPAPTPETTEATPAPISETPAPVSEDDGHASGPFTPLENTFALGQSMQIRVNADGEPNSALLNFRWSVSQLTVQGPPDGSKDGTVEIPVPEGGDLPRYLDNFGFISVENGVGNWKVPVENGFGNQRSVSLYPQDGTPAVSLETKFTLDGEPVKAQDIVGKTGVVTASYTLTNNTTSPTEVTVKNLAGEDVQRTVESDVPLVAIAKTLMPYRFTGLNTGSGLQGADGRGNNQVQWIALPFRPINGDGKATFGWSANVQDGFIPSMLIQIAVLHIPAHEDDPNSPEDESGTNGSDSPVNLDPAVAQIQAGLASVVAGIDELTQGGGEDPLKALEGTLNKFFQSLGTDLTTVATNLDPNVQGSLANQLQSLVAPLTELQDALNAAATNWDDLLAGIGFLVPIMKTPGVGCSAVIGDGPGEIGALFPGGKAQCLEVLAVLEGILADPGTIKSSIDYIRGVLTPVIPLITEVVNAMAGISDSLKAISGGLPTVELPTLDAVISNVVASVLASPGGQKLTGGLAQVSGGVGLALNEISAFAAQAIVALQGGVAAADETLMGIGAALQGMLAKSAESPLIYGPLPENTPPNTVLAAAYEFRVDAADTNWPYTLPRILVGLLALVGAGLIGMFLARRKNEDTGEELTASPVS